jgi:hypothetical protein
MPTSTKPEKENVTTTIQARWSFLKGLPVDFLLCLMRDPNGPIARLS